MNPMEEMVMQAFGQMFQPMVDSIQDLKAEIEALKNEQKQVNEVISTFRNGGSMLAKMLNK